MKPAIRPGAHQHQVSLLERERQECERHGLDPSYFERALLAGAQEFLSRPGKAFRARMIEACFLVAGGERGALPVECLEAVELLHGGSLIIDDIQDDAEMRRGEKALHKIWGMPRALNMGNWLYFVALSRLDTLSLPAQAMLGLSRAAHTCLMRCHEGQALDLTLRIEDVKRSDMPAIAASTSALKTGALMGFAARLGATVAHATQKQIEDLTVFGERVGMGLQMLDDLGSFVSPGREAKALEDLLGQRVTWVWAWASETLDEVTFRQLARQVTRGENLAQARVHLALAVENRGRMRVHQSLSQALNELGAQVEQTPAWLALAAELSRLEKSYG